MTREEASRIIAVVRMYWPHSNLGGNPTEVIVAWHSLLGPFPVETVEQAVKELAAAGREFAPPPGVVVAACSERLTDAPDWDTAWATIDRLILRHGRTTPPPAKAFGHNLVARFALPAWKELCLGPAPGTNGYGTHYAQQREAYNAMRARAGRDVSLAAVGAPREKPRVARPSGDVIADYVQRLQLESGEEDAA